MMVIANRNGSVFKQYNIFFIIVLRYNDPHINNNNNIIIPLSVVVKSFVLAVS